MWLFCIQTFVTFSHYLGLAIYSVLEQLYEFNVPGHIPSSYNTFIILGVCLPATREEMSANVTDAICEFLGLKMADMQYPTPVQAN